MSVRALKTVAPRPGSSVLLVVTTKRSRRSLPPKQRLVTKRRRHGDCPLERSVGGEARHGAAVAEGHPHPARLVDRQPVGVAARHASEDPPVDGGAVAGEVVSQHRARAVVRSGRSCARRARSRRRSGTRRRRRPRRRAPRRRCARARSAPGPRPASRPSASIPRRLGPAASVVRSLKPSAPSTVSRTRDCPSRTWQTSRPETTSAPSACSTRPPTPRRFGITVSTVPSGDQRNTPPAMMSLK